MTAVDGWRRVLYRGRALMGRLGMRPHTVQIVVGTWTAAHTGDGTETQTLVDLVEAGGQPPKVRWLNGEQLALGNLPKGAVEIGPITPAFPGGGTDLGSIDGSAVTQGQTMHLIITGPQHPTGAKYRVTDIKAEKALQYMLTAQPLSE